MTWLAHRLRARHLRRGGHERARMLGTVIRRLRKSGAPSRFSTLWTDAIYGWGNEKWTALEPYLCEVVRTAERTKGPILECGSGLTTLLMGAVTARNGGPVHSLEHNPEWRDRVCEALREHGIDGPAVHLSPLRNFGEYDWYDAPLATLPGDVTLVVCDGPPESTRGGRRGMMPVMKGKLASGCVVLLDDLIRPAEQELVRSWVRDLGASATVHAGGHKFARVRLPEA
jgi:methyltransferase family protein